MKSSFLCKHELDVTDIVCDAIESDEFSRFVREAGIRIVKKIELRVKQSQSSDSLDLEMRFEAPV